MTARDNTDDATETTHSKETMLVAYLTDGPMPSVREALAAATQNSEWLETQEEKKERMALVDTSIYQLEEVEFDNIFRKGAELTEGMADKLEVQNDDIEIATRSVVEEEPTISLWRSKRFLRGFAGVEGCVHDAFEVIGDGFGTAYGLACGATIRPRYHQADTMGLLKHQEEATVNDRYVDKDGAYPVVTMNLTIEDAEASHIDTFSEEVVAKVMKNIARHEHVWKVRTRDCERTVTEEGACYDL